jgi:hypothetical protein
MLKIGLCRAVEYNKNKIIRMISSSYSSRLLLVVA